MNNAEHALEIFNDLEEILQKLGSESIMKDFWKLKRQVESNHYSRIRPFFIRAKKENWFKQQVPF